MRIYLIFFNFIVSFGITSVAQSPVVRLSYIWPLVFIHNKTIPVSPPLQVHGNIQLAENGLLLDGQNSWIDAGDFTGSCMCHPDQCAIGLSLVLRMKFDASARSFVADTHPKFVIDSGGHNGEGISVYTKDGEMFFEVGSKDQIWRISTSLIAEKWHFVLVTWSEDDGLKVFIDGPMVGFSNSPIHAGSKPSATSNHVIIGKSNYESQNTFGRFLIDLVALFDSYVPSGKIYLSYAYSEPKNEGNIRYVNARFVNNADYKLSIFPDRGERRIKGYHLNPKASTLLEFVLREGPLPTGMSFQLQNKETETILTHKGSTTIPVLSSDDSQVITDIQVRQDGKVFVSVSSLGINPNYEISSPKPTTKPRVEGTGIKTPTSKLPSGQVQGTGVKAPTSKVPIGQEQGTGIKAPTSKLPGGQEQGTGTKAPTSKLPSGQEHGTATKAPTSKLPSGQEQGTGIKAPTSKLPGGQVQGSGRPNLNLPGNGMPPIKVPGSHVQPIVQPNRTQVPTLSPTTRYGQFTVVGQMDYKLPITPNISINPFPSVSTGANSYPSATDTQRINGTLPTSINITDTKNTSEWTNTSDSNGIDVITSELPDEDQIGVNNDTKTTNSSSIPSTLSPNIFPTGSGNLTSPSNLTFSNNSTISSNTTSYNTSSPSSGYLPSPSVQGYGSYNDTLLTNSSTQNQTEQTQTTYSTSSNQNANLTNYNNLYNTNETLERQNTTDTSEAINATALPATNLNTSLSSSSGNTSTSEPIANGSKVVASSEKQVDGIKVDNSTNNSSHTQTNNSTNVTLSNEDRGSFTKFLKGKYQTNLPHQLSNAAAYNNYLRDYYKQLEASNFNHVFSSPQNATPMREWDDDSGPDLPAAFSSVSEDAIAGTVREPRPANHRSQDVVFHQSINVPKIRDYAAVTKSQTLRPNDIWTKSKAKSDHTGYAYLINPQVKDEYSVTVDEKEQMPSPLLKLETSNGQPGFALPLTKIESGQVLSAPGLKCHGDISNSNGGLKFDGQNAWIDAGDFSGTFLTDPSISKHGFGVGIKLLLDASIQGYDTPRYILDTGGLSGRGLSIYLEAGKIITIVAVGEQMWTVDSRVDLDEWFYYIMSWSTTSGLVVYINGARYMDMPTPTKIEKNQPENGHFVLGTSVAQDKESFASFAISLIDIFDGPVNTLDMVDYSTPILRKENIWTLSSIKGQKIAGKPEIDLHGNVEEVRGALVFDGENSFLSYGGDNLEGAVNTPQLSPSGLSVALKVKLDKVSVNSYLEERFLIDSGGWLGYGISVFVMEGELFGVVGYQGDIWRVIVNVETIDMSSWLFIVLTFRKDIGIAMYVNGALTGVQKNPEYFVDEFRPSNTVTIGCSILRSSISFAKFQLSLISIFLQYLHVDEIVKISPPLIIKPYFDWFLMLTKNGSTLTTPPLKVKGGVETTENGLYFNGITGWLDAGDLEESADENAEIICEHFAKDISCPRGQVIRVTYANYGRTSDIPCQGKRTYRQTDCVSATSKTIARQLCEGKRSCRMKALNNIWGNTCYGVVKYIEIRYQCIGVIREGEGKVGAHFLTNPSLATEGLTIGLKIKLDRIITDYHDPHYILDSGGHESRGVSVYVMKGRVHCEIGVGNKMWMLNETVAANEWYYLLLTWREDQGLALYINGVLQALERNPVAPPSGGGGGTLSGAFVVGRSALEREGGNARFFITLLTVLRTWISKSESFRMFAMYWGRTINNAMEASVSEQEMAIICEYHTKKIECPADQAIKILSANWGRTSKAPCAWGQHLATNCTSSTAKLIASQVCDGKNFCELTAKTSEWGNPCPGIVKYLEIKYICDERELLGGNISSTYIGNEDPGSMVIP